MNNRRNAPILFLVLLLGYVGFWAFTRKSSNSSLEETPSQVESLDSSNTGVVEEKSTLNLPSSNKTSSTQAETAAEKVVPAEKSSPWFDELVPSIQKSFVSVHGEEKNLVKKIEDKTGPEDDPAALSQFYMGADGKAHIWNPLSKENSDFGGFLPNGEVLKKSSLALPGREFKNYEGSFDVRSSSDGLTYTAFYKTYGKGKDGKLQQLPGIPLVRPAGRYIRVGYKGDSRIAVILDSTGRTDFQFSINSHADTLKTFYSDSSQNIYAVYSHFENGKCIYIIEKYTYSGEKIESMVVDAGTFSIPIETPVKVTENGAVYAMVVRGKDVKVEEHRFSK